MAIGSLRSSARLTRRCRKVQVDEHTSCQQDGGGPSHQQLGELSWEALSLPCAVLTGRSLAPRRGSEGRRTQP